MSEEAVAVVGRVVVASGLAAAAAVPPSLLYNSALSLPCLLLLNSILPCSFSTLQPCLVPAASLLLPTFLLYAHYFMFYPTLFSQPVPALLLPYTLPQQTCTPHPRATIFFYPPHHHSLGPPILYLFVECTPTFLLLIVKSRQVLA